MPPAALASAIAILWPIDAATPSSAGGPVRGSTSPITISVSVIPGSAASAAPVERYAPASNSDAVARYLIIVSSSCSMLFWLVAKRPVHPHPPDVVPGADQAAWLEAQEQDDDEAVEHALELLRAGRERRVNLRAEQAEYEPRRFRQQHDQDGAEHGAERGAQPTDDQDRQRLDREQERKTFDADEGQVNTVQRAGEAGDEGGGDEGEQLVGVQIDAHDAGGGVVVADCDKGAADAAATDVERGKQRENGKAEAEIGKGGVAVEAETENLRPLHRNAAGAVGQPPRFQDHGVDDEGERQRRDREIKPLQPQRGRA